MVKYRRSVLDVDLEVAKKIRGTDVGVVQNIGQFRIRLTFKEYLHLIKINMIISFYCYIYFVTLSNHIKIKYAPNRACSVCKLF
jgi:hypothetical protein